MEKRPAKTFGNVSYGPPQADSRRGATIIMVLGVLGLLSVVAVALFFITKQDEIVTQLYRDTARAQIAAESGVETALAKILSMEETLLSIPKEILYELPVPGARMEDILKSSFGTLDLDGDGLNETSGYVSETYSKYGESYKLKVVSEANLLNINDSNAPLNIDTDPFEDQITPDRNYALIPDRMRWSVEGSGVPGFDPDWLYPSDGAYDPTRSPGGKPYPRARGRLAQTLRELLYVLFGDGASNWNGDYSWAETIADALFEARRQIQSDRFFNFSQVRDALKSTGLMTAAQILELQNYLTLDSWKDPNVLRPTFQKRISVPSLDPSWFPGDWPTSTALGMGTYPNPIARPNTDIRRYMSFDFNYDGAIDPATEHIYHDKWIYLHQDMQTKYFDLDPRSPINVNQAPLPLIRALLRPLHSWYLKEAPEGAEAPRAEDWSMPAVVCYPTFNGNALAPPLPGWIYMFPWWSTHRLQGFSLLSGITGHSFMSRFDNEISHYYFDAYALNYITHDFATGHYIPQYSGQSSRYGELAEMNFELVPDVIDSVAECIYYRVHPDADGDGAPDSFAPFSTWEEFEDFLYRLAMDDSAMKVPGFSRVMADTIMANANPNSRLCDYNPNAIVRRMTDKSKLIKNTTEFSFTSTGGYDISSLGQVHFENGKIAATSKVRVNLVGFELFRITAQNQFMQGYDPLDPAKDAKTFFSESNGVVETHAGGGGYAGHSLQSYPEPELAAANFIQSSEFDGQLMLATQQPPRTELLDFDPMIANLFNRFHAHYMTGLNADHAAGGAPAISTDAPVTAWTGETERNCWVYVPAGGGWRFHHPDPKSQMIVNKPGTRKLTFSPEEYVSNYHGTGETSTWPGNFLPDGALADAGRGLGYNANSIGNAGFSGRVGTAQFWLKPNFDMAHSNRIRSFFTMDTQFENTNSGWTSSDGAFSLLYFGHGGARVPIPYSDNVEPPWPIGPSTNQDYWCPTRSLFWMVNRTGVGFANTIGGLSSETVNQDWRTPADMMSSANPIYYHLTSHQWSILSLTWDIPNIAGMPPATYENWSLSINGKAVPGSRARFDSPNKPTALHTVGAAANYVRFGELSSSRRNNYAADATYDDIISSLLRYNEAQIVEEYTYGRYYAEEDAVYSSPEFDLHSNMGIGNISLELFAVAWTMYWPKEPDSAYPADHPLWNDNRSGGFCNNYEHTVGYDRDPASVFPSDPMASVWKGDWIPISLDVYDVAAGKWRYADNGKTRQEMPHFAGGSNDPEWAAKPLRWKFGEKLRFKLYFNLQGGQTLYTSPVLDDITFYLRRNPYVNNWDSHFEE